MNPQNPYDSCIVKASAGSGKTYQLSRRFLNLVAAGAKPASILTITFTVKAAGEMRRRIIAEATALLYRSERQLAFEQDLAAFYADARRANAILPAPLSARATAQAILSATQQLRITTIDALFKDWVSKFPFESATGKVPLSPRFRMMDAEQVEALNRTAWQALFHKRAAELAPLLEVLQLTENDSGILGIETRVFELFRHYTYCWQREQIHGTAIHPHPLPAAYVEGQSESECIHEIAGSLRAIAAACNRDDLIGEAVLGASFRGLQNTKLITAGFTVSKQILRGSKRERLQGDVTRIEDALRSFDSARKLSALNSSAQALWQIFKLFMAEREPRKADDGVAEFHDLALGCFRLFHGDAGSGAVWLLQQSIQHLLLDEFQDTSLLQWSIFECLARELLSGAGVFTETRLPPTVFIVGDTKQSIYGFREADPIVMQYASDMFAQFGKAEVPLNASFRSAETILQFVNRVFAPGLIDDFPAHGAFRDAAGAFHIPDCGNVTIQPPFTLLEDGPSPVEQEAAFVARYIAERIRSADQPIWDKTTKAFRPLAAADCTMLYRSATHVPIFESALRAEGIAYRRAERRGFFTRPEITDALALLRYCAFPSDENALLTILRSPLLDDVPDLEVINALRTQWETDTPGTDALCALLRDTCPEPLGRLQAVVHKAYVELPSALYLAVLEGWGALTRYQRAFGGLEGTIAAYNLERLAELCLQLEGEGYSNIATLSERLDVLAEADDLPSASPAGDAVTLMTIHKAKGLEAPFVILVEASDLWYKPERYWLKTAQGLAYTGTRDRHPVGDRNFDLLLADQERAQSEEAARLLYVALTRASHYLLITGHGGTFKFLP